MAFLVDILAAGVVDASGEALDSGVAYVYRVGTTVKADVFSDGALTLPASNPVTLDSAGRAQLYVNEEVRLRIEDSAGNLVYEIESLGSFVKLDGDIIIEGDLTVEGDADIEGDTDAQGDFETDQIDATGADTPGWINNLALSYAGGVLLIAGSESDPGYVTVPSTTAGQFKSLKVTANSELHDDVHAASHLTHLGFGITETADWGNDCPFFLYVANKGNRDIAGIDGDSVFFIARSPALATTPSSANDIGDTGAIPVNDSETVILILQDVTVANYVSLPCQLIGAVRMRWATATTDWTVQTLGNSDGLGRTQLAKTFATAWDMPQKQNGAAASSHFFTNGGTIPVFTNNSYKYAIDELGWCTIVIAINGDGGTDGSGSVDTVLSVPYKNKQELNLMIGMSYFASPTLEMMVLLLLAAASTSPHGVSFMKPILSGANLTNDLDTITHANFANGSRSLTSTFRYRAF